MLLDSFSENEDIGMMIQINDTVLIILAFKKDNHATNVSVTVGLKSSAETMNPLVDRQKINN